MTLSNSTKEKFYETTFYDIGIEEKELNQLLCNNISFVADNLSIPHSEFPLKSGRFIDILCKEDTSNKLVVIELKRGESKKLVGQGISYAAELEKMLEDGNFDNLKLDQDALYSLNKNEVRIILVSTDATKEFEWTIEKLQKLKLDIQHVKILPYENVNRFTDHKVLLVFKNLTSGFSPEQPSNFQQKSTCCELKIKALNSESSPLHVEYCVENIDRNEIKKEEIQKYAIDKGLYKAKIKGKYVHKHPNNLRYTVWYIVNYLITKNIEPIDNDDKGRDFLKSLSINIKGELNNVEFIKQARINNFESKQTPAPCFILWRYLCRDGDIIKHDGRSYSVQNFQTINDKEYLEEKFKDFYGIKFVKQ